MPTRTIGYPVDPLSKFRSDFWYFCSKFTWILIWGKTEKRRHEGERNASDEGVKKTNRDLSLKKGLGDNLLERLPLALSNQHTQSIHSKFPITKSTTPTN